MQSVRTGNITKYTTMGGREPHAQVFITTLYGINTHDYCDVVFGVGGTLTVCSLFSIAIITRSKCFANACFASFSCSTTSRSAGSRSCRSRCIDLAHTGRCSVYIAIKFPATHITTELFYPTCVQSKKLSTPPHDVTKLHSNTHTHAVLCHFFETRFFCV